MLLEIKFSLRSILNILYQSYKNVFRCLLMQIHILSYIYTFYLHFSSGQDHLLRFLSALSFYDNRTGWGKHIIQALFLIAIFHVVNLRELPKSPTDCLGQDVDKLSEFCLQWHSRSWTNGSFQILKNFIPSSIF